MSVFSHILTTSSDELAVSENPRLVELKQKNFYLDFDDSSEANSEASQSQASSMPSSLVEDAQRRLTIDGQPIQLSSFSRSECRDKLIAKLANLVDGDVELAAQVAEQYNQLICTLMSDLVNAGHKQSATAMHLSSHQEDDCSQDLQQAFYQDLSFVRGKGFVLTYGAAIQRVSPQLEKDYLPGQTEFQLWFDPTRQRFHLESLKFSNTLLKSLALANADCEITAEKIRRAEDESLIARCKTVLAKNSVATTAIDCYTQALQAIAQAYSNCPEEAEVLNQSRQAIHAALNNQITIFDSHLAAPPIEPSVAELTVQLGKTAKRLRKNSEILHANATQLRQETDEAAERAQTKKQLAIKLMKVSLVLLALTAALLCFATGVFCPVGVGVFAILAKVAFGLGLTAAAGASATTGVAACSYWKSKKSLHSAEQKRLALPEADKKYDLADSKAETMATAHRHLKECSGPCPMVKPK